MHGQQNIEIKAL